MKTIQSVEKAISITNLIAQNNGKLNLTEISKKLGMSMGTLHGFIATLEKCQMIRRDNATGKLFLGDLVFKYSLLNDSKMAFINICKPYLDKICEATKETVHLALPAEEGQIIYVAKSESPFPFRMTSLVGTLEKAELSAVGLMLFLENRELRAVQAEFRQLHDIEYCLKYEPLLDVYCIGVRFQYAPDNSFAGISVVIPKTRFLSNTEEFYADSLIQGMSELQKEFYTAANGIR